MHAFISSVISGFGPVRDAAEAVCRSLDLEVSKAEDLAAAPESPQVACLRLVRDADVVLVLLGARYGDRQASGLSATHEEYREALRVGRPVLAFVQTVDAREPAQEAFVREVQQWNGGLFTSSFDDTTSLREVATRALHRHVLASATARVDPVELGRRAEGLVGEVGSTQNATLVVAAAAGPDLRVLQPSEIEAQALHDYLERELMFGAASAFDRRLGIATRLEGDVVVSEQRGAEFRLSDRGDVVVAQPAHSESRSGLAVLIEEEIIAKLDRSLQLIDGVLEHVDPRRSIRTLAVACAILRGGYLGWKSRAEHEREPNRGFAGRGGDKVLVRPTIIQRGETRGGSSRIATELMVLLRREIRP